MSKMKGLKKTLAVFMAALMVMSTWGGFTPFSLEAKAAEGEPGSYYYRIDINCTDEGEDDNWQQWSWRLFGQYEYGTGEENAQQDSPVSDDKPFYKEQKLDEVKLYEGLFEGYGEPGWFPTRLHVNLNSGPVWNASRKFVFEVKLYVGSCKEDAQLLYSVGSGSNNKFDQDFAFNGKDTYSLPAAKEVKLSDANPATLTIPKVGESAQTVDCSAAVYDQYGVQMTNHTPSYYLTSEAPASYPTNSNAISGVSLSGSTLNVTSDALMSGTTDTRTVYVTAVDTTANTTQYVTKQITLNDPDINFTLYNTKSGTTNPLSNVSGKITSHKYGNTLDAEPSGSREGFEFAGFYTEDFADSYDTADYEKGTKLTKDTEFKADTKYYAAWQANKYTLTFTYRKDDGNFQSDKVTAYYGKDVIGVPNPENIKTTDTNYEFTGWNETVPDQMPAKDATYTAQYKITYNYANLDALNKQTKAAKEIVDSSKYYPNGYTAETLDTFRQAYEAAKQFDSTTKASQQTAVNNAATTLESAIKNLTVKKFVVIFADENGDIITNGYHYVNWGDSVDVPANPTKAYDSENHYTFESWDKYPGDLCTNVTDDAVFTAQFTSEAHSFTETPTASTCTKDGVITKTCSCGYTYTETNSDDLAAHKFSTKTVIEATCSSNGATAEVCSVCGVIKANSVKLVEKTSHAYGDWTTYVEATCTGDGVQYRECSCGAKEYQTVDKLNHDYGSTVNVVKPTCTTGGYSYETCSRCGLVQIFNETKASGHKEATETVAATCTTDGFTRTYCETCKTEISRTTLTKSGHTYGEWTDVVKATCGHDGVQVRECSVCKQIEYEKVDKLTSHSYTDTVTAPTCTAQGYTTHTCKADGCGHSYIDSYVDATGHDMKDSDKSQNATCTSPSITIKECSKCDYTEVTVGDKALGHNFEEVADSTQAATCGRSGYKTMKCSGCGYEYKMYDGDATGNHDWKYETTQTGTQLKVIATCKVCGAKAETTTKVAEGHNYSQAKITKQPTCSATGTMKIYCDKVHDSTCTACIEVTLDKNSKAHAGETETATTPATCTGTGKVVITCKDCNGTIAEYEIPAKGHSYAYDSEVQGTCKAKGSVTLKCSCGDAKTIDTSTNANAHSYKLDKSVDATCTTPAYEVYKCEYCGDTYNKYTDGSAANGHTWGTPTVTQNGNLITVTRSCTVCGEPETVVESYKIDNRHNFSGAVETVKDATCKEAGEIKVYCADEGCTEYVTITVPTNSKAHNNIKTDYTAPTCTADGKVETYCADCEEVLATTVIAKLGHDYSKAGAVAEKPTCTADGKQTYECSRCDSTTEVTIPKKGHDYKKVDADSKTPTCTEYGWDAMKCENCGDTYNKLAEELGHKIEAPITHEPTCTEEGYTEGYCENCNTTVKTDIVPAKGHDYKDGVVTAPTCTSQGYTTHECKNCDYSYKDSYTPLADHDYSGEGCVTVTDPTCTAKGYTTHKCKNCTYSYIDSYTDALGHDFDKTNGEEGTDADGKMYTRYKCTRCDEYQYEYVSDGCAHANAVYVKTVAATCTEVGYDVYSCPTCKDEEIKTNYTDALGHDWDFWYIKTYPSETANGLQERKCLRCGLKEEEEIIYGKYYLVTFYNFDGTRLIRPAYYAYGKAAKMPKSDPTRVNDSAYTYEFIGYNYTQAEIDCVTKPMAIMAQYKATERIYSVTYLDDMGNVLQTSANVLYTKIGATYAGATPTKAEDANYTYTFSTWSVDCDTETLTAVATPVFKATEKPSQSSSEGILTRFIEWIKNFFKKIFGNLF